MWMSFQRSKHLENKLLSPSSLPSDQAAFRVLVVEFGIGLAMSIVAFLLEV